MTAHINDLREHLMQTLAGLRDRENPMEPDRARAVAQVATVLVDTAKVEIDYIKATGADRSDFLETPATTALPAPATRQRRTTRFRPWCGTGLRVDA